MAEPRGSLLEAEPPDGGEVTTPPPVAGGALPVKRLRGPAAGAEVGGEVATLVSARPMKVFSTPKREPKFYLFFCDMSLVLVCKSARPERRVPSQPARAPTPDVREEPLHT